MIRATRPQVNIFLRDGSRLDAAATMPAILSISTSKKIDNPAGQFQLSMIPSRMPAKRWGRLNSWYQDININDIITIGFQRRHGKFCGLIDNISRNHTLSRILGEEVLSIQGRDFGKLLVEDKIAFLPVYTSGKNIALYEQSIKSLFGEQHPLVRTLQAFGPSNEKTGETSFMWADLPAALKYILSNYVSSFHLNLGRGQKKILGGEMLLKESEVKHRSEDKVFVNIPSHYSGSVYNLLTQILDPLFYECFVESGLPNSAADLAEATGEGDDVLSIIRIRPRPFDSTDINFTQAFWPNLPALDDQFTWENSRTYTTNEPYHTIEEGDVIDGGTGVNDYETFTVFQFKAESEILGGEQGPYAQLNLPIIDLYQAYYNGIRPQVFTGRGMITDIAKLYANFTGPLSEEDLISTIVRRKRNRLFNWYRCNQIFESGTIKIPANDKYRVGDRILIKGKRSKMKPPAAEEPYLLDESLLSDGMIFYIQEVEESWQAGSEAYSTLHLIRGHNSFMLDRFRQDAQRFAAAHNVPDFVGV